MKTKTKFNVAIAALFLIGLGFASCKKNNKDVPIPTIGGYNNSNEVAAANLVASWTFEGTYNEVKSGTAVTSSARVSYTPGIMGQAVKMDSGFLFYSSIPALSGMTSFSVSSWVLVRNNGGPTNSFTSMIFQTSKPNSTFGNINLGLETSWKPASNDTLVVHGWYTDPPGGLQDNRNDPYGTPSVGTVLDTAGKWIHLVMTVNNTVPVSFLLYANGRSIGAYNSRGTSVYTPRTPSSVIIGGWMNNVPGQPHTSDTWPHAFVGSIDQLRVYNKALSFDEINALYSLEKAGR